MIDNPITKNTLAYCFHFSKLNDLVFEIFAAPAYRAIKGINLYLADPESKGVDDSMVVTHMSVTENSFLIADTSDPQYSEKRITRNVSETDAQFNTRIEKTITSYTQSKFTKQIEPQRKIDLQKKENLLLAEVLFHFKKTINGTKNTSMKVTRNDNQIEILLIDEGRLLVEIVNHIINLASFKEVPMDMDEEVKSMIEEAYSYGYYEIQNYSIDLNKTNLKEAISEIIMLWKQLTKKLENKKINNTCLY